MNQVGFHFIGLKTGPDIINTQLVCNPLCGSQIVPRQHHATNPHTVQTMDHGGGLLPEGIQNRDQAGYPVVGTHNHDGLAIALQYLQCLIINRCIVSHVPEQLWITDIPVHTVKTGLRSETGNRRKIADTYWINAKFPGMIDNSNRQWML